MPNSLTRVFPRTLEFSSCLPVSVLVRAQQPSLEVFLDKLVPAPSLLSPEAPHHFSAFVSDGFACQTAYLLGRALPFARALSFLCHSIAQTVCCGTGMSTCCPSPTRLRLGLGPDLPWVDDRCPGILRLSVGRILTFLFDTHTGILSSCLSSCPSGQPSPMQERSPTHVSFKIHAKASVPYFSPEHFRRRVSRPVSYYALF